MQATPANAARIDPPTVVVHGSSELRPLIVAARKAGSDRLRLMSAPDAACFLGPAWWRALMEIAASAATGTGIRLEDVLDCGDAAGRALEALRLGQRVLVLEPSLQWQAVRARAEAAGALLLRARPPALDLADPGADRHLAQWLRAQTTADDSTGEPG